jgi:hypothetical protein
MDRWPQLRDVYLTSLGGVVILSQLVAFFLGKVPSDILCATGLALTAPATVKHIRTVLGADDRGPSLPPPPASGPRHSSSPRQEGPGGE